jgi:hypothetical protein
MSLSALTSSIRKSPAPTSSLDMNAYVDTVFRGKNADDFNISNFVVRTSGESYARPVSRRDDFTLCCGLARSIGLLCYRLYTAKGTSWKQQKHNR